MIISSNQSYLNSLSTYYQNQKYSSLNKTLNSIASSAISDSDSTEKLLQTLNSTEETSREQKLTDKFKTKLDELVTAGTITEEQEDAVLSAIKPSSSDAPPAPGQNPLEEKLSSLVSDGTITDDQMTAIQEVLKPDRNEMMTENGNMFKMQLDSLVSDGTLTEDQEKSVLTALQSTKTDFGPGGKSLSDKLDELVSSQVITSDQKDAIDAALKPPEAAAETSKSDNQSGGLISKLDELVTAGTLTQDQEDTVLEALWQNEQSKSNPFQNYVSSLYEQFASSDLYGLDMNEGTSYTV